jgi:hypothetical protein
MATATIKRVAVMLATAAIAAAGRPAFATTEDVPLVILHVTDYALVSGRNLETAEHIAARVYAKIGVLLRWVDGHAATAAPDGAIHLDVVILNADMTAHRHAPPDALGQGRRESRRASIYYERIIEYACRTRGDLDQIFALTLAHEVGHMLLPEYSHSHSGLMRATWKGRIVGLPDFLPSQAAAIRRLLMVDTERQRAIGRTGDTQ